MTVCTCDTVGIKELVGEGEVGESGGGEGGVTGDGEGAVYICITSD